MSVNSYIIRHIENRENNLLQLAPNKNLTPDAKETLTQLLTPLNNYPTSTSVLAMKWHNMDEIHYFFTDHTVPVETEWHIRQNNIQSLPNTFQKLIEKIETNRNDYTANDPDEMIAILKKSIVWANDEIKLIKKANTLGFDVLYTYKFTY